VAVALGGLWTYWLFVRKRVTNPRLNVEVSAASAPAPENQQLLQVRVELVNCGEVLVQLASVTTRVQQVSPVLDQVLPAIASHDPLNEAGSREIDWPMIASRITKFSKGKAEIEPGERDEFVYDFVVQADVTEVQIYTFIENVTKKGEIGWQRTLRVRLPELAGGGRPAPTALLQSETTGMTPGEKSRPPERVEKQQPPKPRPTPLREQQPPKAPPPVRDPGKKP